MATLIRFLPGLIAAVFAFVAIKLLTTLGFGSLGFQAVAFFAVYVVVLVLADKAMRTYGRTDP